MFCCLTFLIQICLASNVSDCSSSVVMYTACWQLTATYTNKMMTNTHTHTQTQDSTHTTHTQIHTHAHTHAQHTQSQKLIFSIAKVNILCIMATIGHSPALLWIQNNSSFFQPPLPRGKHRLHLEQTLGYSVSDTRRGLKCLVPIQVLYSWNTGRHFKHDEHTCTHTHTRAHTTWVIVENDVDYLYTQDYHL